MDRRNTVYGKKSFLSKESDTKLLQSIYFAYEVGIISSKGGSSPYKCRAYPSGSKKRQKAKEAKMREQEVAAKSRNIHVTIL